MGWHSFWSKVEDQVKNEAENLDDLRRENPIISAGIPYTPENLAALIGGGALLGGAYLGAGALAGGGAAGAGTAAGAGAAGAGTAAGAGAAGGGMGLGTTLLGLGSIGASLYGANQAGKASDAQIAAGERASALEAQSAANQLALQKQIWEKQQADQAPYLQQGQWGINRLGQLMQNTSNGAAIPQSQQPFTSHSSSNNSIMSIVHGLHGQTQNPKNQQPQYTQVANQGGGQLNNPFDTYLKSKGLAGGRFDTSNPAYQFQLQQGQRALDSSAAARGMGYSGAQMRAAQKFGQGLASQEYDKQYNRANQEFGDYFNRVAGLSQGGQQAATTLGQQGSNYAQNAGTTYSNLSNAQTGILGQQANARASGYAANANAVSNTLGNLTNLYAMNKYYG